MNAILTLQSKVNQLSVNLGIKRGLVVGLSLITFCVVLAIGFSINQVNDLVHTQQRVEKDLFPKLILIERNIRASLDSGILIRDAMAYTRPGFVDRNIQRQENHIALMQQNLEELRKSIRKPEALELLDFLDQQLVKIHTVTGEVFAFLKNDQEEEAREHLMASWEPANQKFFETLDKLAEFEKGLLFTELSTASESAQWTLAKLYLLGVVIVGVTLCLSLLFYWVVDFFIKSIRDDLKLLASGDFRPSTSKSFSKQSELGKLQESITQVKHALYNTAQEIRGGVEQLRSAASQLQGTSTAVHSGSHSQLEITELSASEISALSEELKILADQVNMAKDHAEQAGAKSTHGNELMRAATQDARAVLREVETTSDALRDLLVKFQDVGSIVANIEGIASQINMLALNAAIEASRAGESGRGFAVVADEVRRLAETTREAATSSTDRIQSIQKSMESAVSKMMGSKNSVHQVVDAVIEVQQVITDTHQSTLQAASVVEHVSQAVLVKSRDSDNICDKVRDVTEKANSNLDSVGELQHIAGMLGQISQTLTNSATRFRTQD